MLTVSDDHLSNSGVEICHNGNCLSGNFGPWKGGFFLQFPDASATPQGIAFVRKDATGVSVNIGWGDVATDLADGDRYDVTWTASDGTILAETHQTATYTLDQPNGPQCPPTCHVFSGNF